MLNKEIGSYFSNIELSDKSNNIFNNDYCFFISGRAALYYVIKDIQSKYDVKTIAIPSYCCDTMIKPILDCDLKIVFYPVTIVDGKLDININVKADILLKLDYFGYENDKQTDFDGIIICDKTHSIFVDKNEYDYTFGSLRKWSGFIDGGFAKCKNGFKIENPKNTNHDYKVTKLNAMKQKEDYLNGSINNKDYLNTFNKLEDQLENYYDYGSDSEDILQAKMFDIEFVKKRRQENAKELLKCVKDYALFKEINENDCPLFVPIIVPDNKRNELRKVLIGNNIYCPVHWPLTDLHNINEEEKFLYNNELSLICDQRYNIDDMKRICQVIEEFIKC